MEKKGADATSGHHIHQGRDQLVWLAVPKKDLKKHPREGVRLQHDALIGTPKNAEEYVSPLGIRQQDYSMCTRRTRFPTKTLKRRNANS